jgi:hypothetical protein
MPAFGRSVQDFGDLYLAEELLLEAAIKGTACDLGSQVPDEPVLGLDNPDDRHRPNFVRAEFVRFLVLGGDEAKPVHEKGVRLQGAWIGNKEENIDLTSCKNVLPLFLNYCRINGNIVLRDARTGTVDLDYSVVEGGIEARGAFINGSLYLRSLRENIFFEAKKGMDLVDATIVGSLECHNARFHPRESEFKTENGTAIFASRVNISGSVFLQQTFSADGPTVFRNARIGGNFECSGGSFDKVRIEANKKTDDRAKRAIDCQGAKIGGGVFFRQRDKRQKGTNFKANGEICFIDTQIGGSFECHGAEIHNPQGSALICSRTNVTGTVFLHEGFSAEGSVIFRRATIGGHFECSGGTFMGSAPDAAKPDNWLAIDCQGAKIGGSVYLRKDEAGISKDEADAKKTFFANGQVRFIDAEIAGSFECHGAAIENKGKDALGCSRIKVGGSVLLIDGFSAEGEVSFRRANVGGNFDASNAKFYNMSAGASKALSCEGIHVTGDALLGMASGSSRDHRESASKCAADKASKEPAATSNNREVVDKNKNFRAYGQVDFSGAQIEGDFDGEGGQFINRRENPNKQNECDYSLKLRSARITRALRLGAQKDEAGTAIITKIEGGLDLRGAKVSVFVDSEESWPEAKILDFEGREIPCYIYLSGFDYEYFGGNSSLEVRTRKRWLLRQPKYEAELPPQPFEQLIKVLKGMGHYEKAIRIAIFRESDKKPGDVLPLRFISLPNPLNKAIRNAYGVMFGFGYKWQRIFYAAVVLWLSCGAVYNYYYSKGNIELNTFYLTSDQRNECKAPPQKDRNCPQFSPLIFSANAMLPLVASEERRLWKFTNPEWYNLLNILYRFQTIFGWVFGISLGVILSKKVSRD